MKKTAFFAAALLLTAAAQADVQTRRETGVLNTGNPSQWQIIRYEDNSVHDRYREPHIGGYIGHGSNGTSWGIAVDTRPQYPHYNPYRRGYWEGYHDGRRRQPHVVRQPYPADLNDIDEGMDVRFQCTLKVHATQYAGAGHYRDSAQRRALQNCMISENESACRSAAVNCKSVW